MGKHWPKKKKSISSVFSCNRRRLETFTATVAEELLKGLQFLAFSHEIEEFSSHHLEAGDVIQGIRTSQCSRKESRKAQNFIAEAETEICRTIHPQDLLKVVSNATEKYFRASLTSDSELNDNNVGPKVAPDEFIADSFDYGQGHKRQEIAVDET